MLIEFQNCSLSIGYVGTPREIAIAKRVDAIGRVADDLRVTFQDIYDACEKAAEQIWSGMSPGFVVGPKFGPNSVRMQNIS